MTGILQDPAGRPVAEAIVELWSPTERLAVTATSPSGRFQFGLRERAVGLWIRRIGYRAKRYDLGGTTSDLALVLQPLALELTDLSLNSQPLCPHPEEPEARALVLSMAERYSHGLDTLGISTWSWFADARVKAPGLELFDTTTMGVAHTGTSGAGRRYQNRLLQGYGYALPGNGGMGEAVGRWDYMRLDGALAAHFGDSLFTIRHRFYFIDRESDPRRVGFCPLTRGGTAIEGILELTASNRLTRATWFYRTAKPVEEAGGEATFAPTGEHSEAPQYLLPVTGLFWRRLSPTSFYQRWQKYDGWSVSFTDSIPRRPRATSQ